MSPHSTADYLCTLAEPTRLVIEALRADPAAKAEREAALGRSRVAAEPRAAAGDADAG